MIYLSLSQVRSGSICSTLVISCLDFCDNPLAGQPACTIKHLQMVWHAPAHLVFSDPETVYVTPCFITLLCLAVATHINVTSQLFGNRVAWSTVLNILELNIQLWFMYLLVLRCKAIDPRIFGRGRKSLLLSFGGGAINHFIQSVWSFPPFKLLVLSS